MLFADSTGFYSLVCLLIQCVLAWVCAAIFGVLLPGGAAWMRSFFMAFVGLGIGLTALSVRFSLAHMNGSGMPPMADGMPATRAFYGVYLAGKFLFLAGLTRGVFRWRRRVVGRGGGMVAMLLVIGFSFGYALPTIEAVLTLQAPCVVAVSLVCARCLRADVEESDDPGLRIVRHVFHAMAVVWALYLLAALLAGMESPKPIQPLGFVLRSNSLFDLTLQVAMACGLIVAMMAESTTRTMSVLEERDRLREQVLRDDKLRTTATLISGVAHEINNPLTAILGYIEDLQSLDGQERREAARIIREQAERCRGIVQRMSVIGRRRLLRTSRFAVLEAVQRVVDGMRPQADQTAVEVRVDVPADLELVADLTGFEQVLTNLLANALQASPRGAEVLVATRTCEAGLTVRVVDHGTGIPPDHVEHVFEPFWTTKHEQQGTGLGLAVADAIVQAHEGSIEIGEGADGGAVVAVLWPWRQDSSSESALPADAPAMPASGNRMLVIDDEALVRSLIKRHAGGRGWEVEDLPSAETAAHRLFEEGADFDAIVCDLRMPGMSGVELHDEMERRAPHLLAKTVFITGDLASQEALAFAERCKARIVTKPFSVEDLVDGLGAGDDVDRAP